MDTRWLFLEADEEDTKKDKDEKDKEEKDDDKKKDDKKDEYNNLIDEEDEKEIEDSEPDEDDDDDSLPGMDEDDDYNNLISDSDDKTAAEELEDDIEDTEEKLDDLKDDIVDSKDEYNTLVIVGDGESSDEGGDNLFEKIAKAGYAFTVISANMHHIHLLAAGKKFDRIHSIANDFYYYIKDKVDFLFELALESGLVKLDNAANASKHCEEITLLQSNRYDYDEACQLIDENLVHAITYIEAVRSAATSRTDIQSEMDSILTYLNKQHNYFMRRRRMDDAPTSDIESTEESYNLLF